MQSARPAAQALWDAAEAKYTHRQDKRARIELP